MRERYACCTLGVIAFESISAKKYATAGNKKTPFYIKIYGACRFLLTLKQTKQRKLLFNNFVIYIFSVFLDLNHLKKIKSLLKII